MGRELVGAGGIFAPLERHAGGGALRIFDKHAARCDTSNAPRRVSEQHDVARKTFDREVFVNRTDGYAFGLRNDGIERFFGDCAAARDGSEPRSTAGAQNRVKGIPLKVGSIAAGAAGGAFA